MTDARGSHGHPLRRWLVRQWWRSRCLGVRRFVFCISTGRTGTTTLSQILKCVPNCVTLHEPFPQMNGDIMHAFNHGRPEIAERRFWRWKLPEIYKAAAGRSFYVETTNMFIKSFHPFAVRAFGKRMSVIYLERDCREVASSYYGRGSIPRSDGSSPWQLDPLAPGNLLDYRQAVAGDPRWEHDYLKCVWNWHEVRARAAKFERDFPDTPLHRITTQELNQPDRVQGLLSQLFGDFDEQLLASSLGERANASPVAPQPPADLSEDVLHAFLARLTELSAR